MKKLVVVLGSNSFSGSHFIDLTLEIGKYYVVGISRSSEKSSLFLPYKSNGRKLTRFYQIDMTRQTRELINLLTKLKPAFIVNFAAFCEVASSWKYPEDYFAINTSAVVALAQFLKSVQFPFRFVQISTPEVYGNCRDVKEDAPIHPSTPYAASKAAADLFLATLISQYRFPAVFVRSTNVYGPHQQLFRIIPKTVIAIKKKQRIPLHGGGTAVKSYLHIKDACRGIYCVMESGNEGEVYHLSPERGQAIADIVRMICTRMGASFEDVVKKVGQRPGQDAVYIIDSSKARKAFGWRPEISFSSGIDEVIDWIEKNWEEIKTMPVEYAYKP